jgi:hypothetical protein
MADHDEVPGSEENGQDARTGEGGVAGRQPPFEGRQPPFEGRQEATGGGRVFVGGSSRETGVVVRATVESFGQVGETELNVSIKWPAGCNSSPVVEQGKRTVKPRGSTVNVDR